MSVVQSDVTPIDRLFVYGTLLPGDVRWGLLEPLVVDSGRPDSVAGRLYDTGLDYPAAVFGAGGSVLGRTFTLRRDRLADALAILDAEEDTALGLYRRVAVATGAGVRAWAYEYGDGLTLVPIESGDWLAR